MDIFPTCEHSQDVPAISDFLFCLHVIPYLIPTFQYIMILLNKSFLELYLSLRISYNKNEYFSFWILFMNSFSMQLQTEFEAILRTRSVPNDLRPLYRNDCAAIWNFAKNIVFQKLNEKAWIIFL